MTTSRILAPASALATLTVLGLAALPQAAHAQAYTFYTFDYSGADDTFALGINNSGEIVGGYDITSASSGDTLTTGFTVSAASVTSSSLSSSDFTSYGIGETSELDGINNSGQIVGDYYDDSTGNENGFLLNGMAQTDFSSPGDDVEPAGINDSGVVSGYVTDENGVSQGFVRSASGAFTFFDDPNADSDGTNALGLNNAGAVVGSYDDAATGLRTAFLYQSGMFTDIAALDGFHAASANSINNNGDIGGNLRTSDGMGGTNPTEGFVLTASGTLTTLAVPGADKTIVDSLNDSDDAVGYYQDSSGFDHGFLAIPNATPEPSAFVGLGIGLLGLGALGVKARRRVA